MYVIVTIYCCYLLTIIYLVILKKINIIHITKMEIASLYYITVPILNYHFMFTILCRTNRTYRTVPRDLNLLDTLEFLIFRFCSFKGFLQFFSSFVNNNYYISKVCSNSIQITIIATASRIICQ